MKIDRMPVAKKNRTKMAIKREPGLDRIPISLSGRVIGSLVLGLDLTGNLPTEARVYAVNALTNAFEKCRAIEEDVDFVDHLNKRKGWGMNIAASFVYYQPMLDTEDGQSKPRQIAEKANEAVFLDMIRAYGMTALRNPEVNSLIGSWLKDKKSAGNSINKIAKALMDFAGVSALSLKPGKPEAKIVSAIGASRIRSLYEDLREVLVLLKRDEKGYRQSGSDPLELLPLYWDEFYHSLRDKYEHNPKANANCYRKVFALDPPYGLPAMMFFDLLREDILLQDEFWRLDWVPSEMARALLGKLLGVSSSKVISVLFR